MDGHIDLIIERLKKKLPTFIVDKIDLEDKDPSKLGFEKMVECIYQIKRMDIIPDLLAFIAVNSIFSSCNSAFDQI